jgi:hypothetical protein
MRTSSTRDSRLVHNPLLGLPATQELLDYLQTVPGVQARLTTMLIQLGAQADAQADHCWRAHKAPMAAYWKAVAVYARHTAKSFSSKTNRRSAHG